MYFERIQQIIKARLIYVNKSIGHQEGRLLFLMSVFS